MSELDDIFDLVAKQDPTQGGNWIRDGKGRLIVQNILFEKLTGGPTFVAEFVVESSQKVAVVALKFPSPGAVLNIEPNEPGTTCSIVLPVTGDAIKQKSVAGNIKKVILGIMGFNNAQMTPDEFRKLLKEATNKNPSEGRVQPMRGMVVDFETYRRLNKVASAEYTRVNWMHVPRDGANKPELIKERREKLGGDQVR